MKKQKLYMMFIGLLGVAVFVFSVFQTFALFADPETLFENILYCVVVLVLMLLCHMLPIYITADKTMEISFVPVVACLVTKGMPLATVLFALRRDVHNPGFQDAQVLHRLGFARRSRTV
jgi:hypothetical protein